MTRRPLLLTALAVCLAGLAGARAQERPDAPSPADENEVTVLVLGTYHFANPGMDLNNVDAVDVLSDRRQAELERLSRALVAFEPTVVAVEDTALPPYEAEGWATFTDDMLATTPNERVQIGFRVARDAAVDRVYAIDEQPGEGEPDYFPFDAVLDFAEAAGRQDELSRVVDMTAAMAAIEAAQDRSIAEALIVANGDVLGDEMYWEILTYGEGERQPGPELAAYWFLRNAKIFNKLTQVTRPGDRVIVVYGSGHGHWLREMIERTPGYVLEPLTPYLERAAER